MAVGTSGNVRIFTWRDLFRETILGYLFWTLFQALAPMIWFYPLNDLEISGYEAFAVMLFSPVLLGIPGIGSLLRSSVVLALLRLISVASLASFQTSSTLHRLVSLSVGCFTIMLVLTTSLTHRSSLKRSQTIAGLVLGLLAFVSSRVWFTTFVPAWWTPMTNNIVITITAIASIDKILDDSRRDLLPVTPITPSKVHPLSEPHITKASDEPPPTPTLRHPPVTLGSSLATGLGFGSLLYIIQAVFGEVSVASRWVVTGRPDCGPEPYPWGAAVLVALWLGSVLASHTLITSSLLWWLVGFASFLALYLLPTWQGFVGGLILAVYVTSVLPILADQVSMAPPGRTMLVVALTWLVEILFSVWTVAYNFVPGGVYTREKTSWLIIASMLCIGLALLTGRRLASPFHSAGSFSAFLQNKPQIIRTKSNLASSSSSKLSSASTSKPSSSSTSKTSLSSSSPSESVTASPARTKVSYMLTLLMLVGLGGFIYRNPRQHFQHPAKTNFTAAIWTYHFGYDNKGWPSLEQSADMLESTGADFITLLESDASKPFLGNNDLGMWLGERLGMYVDFGPSTRDHTWGNLILSKYPIVKSQHHLLPSPEGELAPSITATVDYTPGVEGGHVDFVVTHMGNDRDTLDRKLQAEFLSNELNNAKNPVVFLGYITSMPGSRDYVTLTKRGNVKDIDSTDGDRWCEYIMYRGLTRLGYARISHGGLSDTEVQCAKFRISSDEKDHDKTTTDPSAVDESVRFNPRFGGYSDGHNWARSSEHRFHMSTPKYFIPSA